MGFRGLKEIQDTTRWQHRAKYDSPFIPPGYITTLDHRNGQYITRMSLLCLIKDKIREIKIGPHRKVNIEAEAASCHCTEQTLN